MREPGVERREVGWWSGEAGVKGEEWLRETGVERMRRWVEERRFIG